jgi:tetratricopeptide (TPR) repeat protein
MAEIDAVLREGTPEMKGQCLFYRGMIRQSQGSLESAKEDWLDALRFAQEGTFLRYEFEHNIGKACEESGELEEARSWYRTALKTCSTGEGFSGHRTLTAFIWLSDGPITPDDNVLLASAIQKSWRVLELSAEPDLIDLAASISALTTRFDEMIADATADT